MSEVVWFFVGCFVGAGLVGAGVLVGQLHTNALKRLYPCSRPPRNPGVKQR